MIPRISLSSFNLLLISYTHVQESDGCMIVVIAEPVC